MPVRRFCLIVWFLIVCAIVAFILVSRRRARNIVLVAKGFEAHQLAQAPMKGPEDQSKADQAVRLLTDGLTSAARDPEHARAWLGEYRRLVATWPDLRPVLAKRLFDAALASRARLKSRQAHAATEIAEQGRDTMAVLVPPALEEVRAMREAEPDNALWPTLLLTWELREALEPEPPPDQPTPGQRWEETYRIADPTALDNARQLARQHPHWDQADWQIDRERDLVLETVRERGLGPHGEVAALVAALLPSLSEMREVHRRCIFLGYQTLEGGDREEARLWFGTSLALGRLMLRPDNMLIETLVAILIMGNSYDALRDWHAAGGDFLAARRMAEPRSDLTQASRQIARGHIDLAFGGFAKQPMQILVASSYTMGAGAVAAALCAVVSFVALVHLAVERRAQRRAALPAPHLRWHVRDGFWVAAVAVTPVLLFAVALICFRPDLHAAFPMNLVLVTVGSAVASPALLAGLSSRRVWRRLQEAGGTGGPSVFWPVLVWVFLMVLGATVLLGRPLGLTGYSTQAGPPAGGVVMPLAIALAVVGVVGFVVSAVRALARRSPSVAERAQRTAWLVRAFTLAVLVLVLFTFAAAFVTADRFDACWRESAEVLKAETTHYLGQVWIKKYFPRPDEAATQPASAPAATPAAPDS